MITRSIGVFHFVTIIFVKFFIFFMFCFYLY